MARPVARPVFGSIGWALALAALASACEKTSSADRPTRDIDAEIQVSATSGNASTVRVTLYPGGGARDPLSVVELEGGDALYASTGGQRNSMAAGTLDYETSFGAGAADALFGVSLDRARADFADAPGSAGLLPTPFNMGLSGTDVSRAQDVILTWAPSGTADTMTLDIQGSCVEDRTIPVAADPGTLAVSSGTLMPEITRPSCQVTLTLHRTRSGVVDAALNPASTFSLEQVRTASFFSRP